MNIIKIGFMQLYAEQIMNVIIQGKGTGDVQDKMNCQVTEVKECVTSSCKVDL